MAINILWPISCYVLYIVSSSNVISHALLLLHCFTVMTFYVNSQSECDILLTGRNRTETVTGHSFRKQMSSVTASKEL